MGGCPRIEIVHVYYGPSPFPVSRRDHQVQGAGDGGCEGPCVREVWTRNTSMWCGTTQGTFPRDSIEGAAEGGVMGVHCNCVINSLVIVQQTISNYGCLGVEVHVLDEWRFITMGLGAQFVMTPGI